EAARRSRRSSCKDTMAKSALVFIAIAICVCVAKKQAKSCTDLGGRCLTNCLDGGITSARCQGTKMCCQTKKTKPRKKNSKRICKNKKKCKKAGGKCLHYKTECKTEVMEGLCKGASCNCCHKGCKKTSRDCSKLGGSCKAVSCPDGTCARPGCKGTNCVCCNPCECSCGKSNPSRIVGGEVVNPQNKYPWQAWLKVEGEYQCGGSIINDLYILTAAHCVYGGAEILKNDKVEVVIADHNKDSTDDDIAGVTRTIPVDKVIVHEDYEVFSFSNDNDISLIKLSESLDFKSLEILQPVCLPHDDSSTYEGEKAVVTGWGYTEGFGFELPSLLHEVTLPVLAPDCPEYDDYVYGGYDYNYEYYDRSHTSVITENMICAGKRGGGKDSCNGDSGSPLVLGQAGVYVQIGIVSFGPPDCDSPGVYTRVSKYLGWIADNTKDAKTCG
ncbi:unnamed protein product, partial [Meganyctiphanes norvegica]